MSTIVQWDTAEEIKTTSNYERDAQLLEGILKLKPGNPWIGTINKNKMVIELRKRLRDSHVLITIGQHKHHLDDPDRNVCISANGKMFFTEEELNEMNLAVLEAKNVYENMFREQVEYLKEFYRVMT